MMATTAFTILRHLGMNVKLYNGSWGEYVNSAATVGLEKFDGIIARDLNDD